MMLLTKKGCIPCARVKEALAASPSHRHIPVSTYDLSNDLDRVEWQQHRERFGFTLSPVLVDGNIVVAAGIMAISSALGLHI